MTSRRSRYAWSIGARLTGLYTVVIVITMVLFAIALAWHLSATFTAEHQRFLRDKVAELQKDLDAGGGSTRDLLAEIQRETGDRDVRQYDARILAANGRLLGETPGMRAILPVSFFAAAPASATFQTRFVGGRMFALARVPMRNRAGTMVVQLEIALDVTRDHRLMTRLHEALWLALGGLTLLLVLAGYVVSTRGLAPLQRVTTAVRAINPAHLAARIPTDPPWPRELAELVEVFNAMLTRLEESFARLSRFSADLAHELRTPLGNMSGVLEVCLLRERSDAEYRAALESNLEECRRLGVLIDNLLFMAHAERAEQAIRVESFDGREVCGWVITQQTAAATARDMTIQVAGDTRVSADPVLFRQALTNLVANAIAHAGPGAHIRVALDSDSAASRVRVSDDGVGIAPEHLPHVFDRFYRADPARSRGQGKGTGLGLAIVKTIVELHGGSVEIRSTLGHGTVVTLQFPVVAERASECSTVSDTQTARLMQMTGSSGERPASVRRA